MKQLNSKDDEIKMKVAQNEIQLKATKSVCLQPRGSIYQNGFFWWSSIKFFSKSGLFDQKMGNLFEKNPKNWTV